TVFPEREEWLLRIGVNGLWKSQYFPDVGNKAIRFRPELSYELFLSENDALAVSVHGVEFNPVGDFMRTGHANRRLLLNGVEVAWPRIVHPDPDPKVATQIWIEMVKEYVERLEPTLGLENAPLGIIDPALTAGSSVEFSNPLLMNNASGTNKTIERTAKLA